MALGSRQFLILNAIAATLNADADLLARAFKVRKKPYNRGSTWLPGAFVTPAPWETPYHETTEDEIIYRQRVVIVDPKDSDLTSGLESHLGAFERVQEIFRRKSHGFMPATMRALDTTFATAVTAGKYAASKIQATDVIPDNSFVDQAFEAGYDASGCIVTVRVLCSRYNSQAL